MQQEGGQVESGAAGESFASYLARVHVAQKGFQRGVPPEADALRDACDIVLTGQGAFGLHVVCLVDAESDPGKAFGLAPAQLGALAAQLKARAAKGLGRLLPIVVDIVEVRRAPPTDAQRERLQALRQQAAAATLVLSVWSIDAGALTAWGSGPPVLRSIDRRWLEQLLREPRHDDAALQPVSSDALRKPGLPVVTAALLAILAVAFALVLLLAEDPTTGALAPSVRSLVAFGGLAHRLLIDQGQWWRLVSAVLLHGDILHLLFNGLALAVVGKLLESLIGRAWFAAVFVLGGLGGSLLSVALNPPMVVSVGASGAIMALAAAALACSFRLADAAQRRQAQIGLLQVLVPALIPLATTVSGGRIDYAAHLGGALVGLVLGLALLKLWPRAEARPRLRAVALGVAAAGLLAFGVAAVAVAQTYRPLVLVARLIPPDQMPRSEAEAQSRAPEMAQRYPHDPRPRMALARRLLDARDLQGAERELRAGLAEEEMLRHFFRPELTHQFKALLALTLADSGRRDEARDVARSVCIGLAPEPIRRMLAAAKLCE